MVWTPCIEIATAAGVREVRLQSRLLGAGKILLNGEITAPLADEVIAQLLYLKGEGIDPVLFINSNGGSVNAGLAICDALRAYPGPVSMLVTGMAASMAAVIFSNGTKGRRFVLPHAEVMIHQPLIGDCPGGNAGEIRRRSQSLLKTRDVLSGILAENTGHTLEEVNERIEYGDYSMTGPEAVEFGIADAVLENLYDL